MVVIVLGVGAACAFFCGPARPGRCAGQALGFAGAWFFGILSVTSFVPGIYQMIVEHRMYLSLAAVTTLAVVGLWRWLGRIALPVSLVWAGVLGYLTYERNGTYGTPLSLWQDTVDRRPENETAQVSLAIALFDAGKAAEAIPHYEAALRLKPQATDTLNDLGCALASLGRVAEAIPPLAKAVKIEPGVPEYHFNLANTLAAAGRFDEAIGQFRETIRLEPGHVQAHLKLATALWLAGRKDEAVAERSEGLRLQGTAAP